MTSTYTAETDVLSTVKDLLDTEWDTHSDQIPKPKFGIWNEIARTQPNQLKNNDLIEIRYGSPAETQQWEGHAKEYIDYRHRVALIIHTCQGRQRMQDLKAEMRRILFKNKFALYPPYQLITYLGFGESNVPTMRYWTGTVTIELSADGKPADSD
jgi:hypothetical protein